MCVETGVNLLELGLDVYTTMMFCISVLSLSYTQLAYGRIHL